MIERYTEPLFCFTTDLDWAPEWAIEALFARFEAAHIPLTPFITHDSETIKRRFSSQEKRHLVGVHPNFLPGSSHGDTVEEVVNWVMELWPEASCFRSHSFVDGSHITEQFARLGMRFDSNLCLFLQPNCVPLSHQSGMLRMPVFWEDDVHYKRGLPFELDQLRSHLDLPGLKVFNIHPLLYALNVPSEQYYSEHKHAASQAQSHDWRNHRYEGKGVCTLVDELLDYIKQSAHRTVWLWDAWQGARGESGSRRQLVFRTKRAGVATEQKQFSVETYQVAAPEVRAQMVREEYDSRDGEDIYATSRDFNLRELEIDFIRERITGGRVLDIGCGNGYTLLSIARHVAAEYIGLDFSGEMIRGARALTERLRDNLKSVPEFREADVRTLPFPDNSFDCVISERCLLNLPTVEDQLSTIAEVHRVLRPGGRLVMVEGTEDGLERLNRVRGAVGLSEIPTASGENISSLKFRETALEEELGRRFTVRRRQHFGTYYLISRVVHPLLAYPEKPQFEARINAVARQVAEIIPDIDQLGHVVGYEAEARK